MEICRLLAAKSIAKQYVLMVVPQKLETELLFDPSNSLPKRTESRNSQICIPMFVCSIIHNNPEAEAIQVFINGWTDKLNVVCAYNGILFSPRNESLIHVRTWMNPEDTVLCEIRQWQSISTLWFHLHEGPRVVQREWWLPEAGEEEEMRSLTSEVLALEDERVLEVDGGRDWRKMWMYLMPLNCTLKSDN